MDELSLSVYDEWRRAWRYEERRDNWSKKSDCHDTRMRQKGGVDPSYFVQAMVNVELREEITLEMKKAGVKNYIEIVRLAAGEVEHAEDEESDDVVAGLEEVAAK
jgi:hypothetical protein